MRSIVAARVWKGRRRSQLVESGDRGYFFLMVAFFGR